MQQDSKAQKDEQKIQDSKREKEALTYHQEGCHVILLLYIARRIRLEVIKADKSHCNAHHHLFEIVSSYKNQQCETTFVIRKHT